MTVQRAEVAGDRPIDAQSLTMLNTTVAARLQAFGVPEEHLRGHAFHTYSLKSDDGTVEFQFRHNVCGRRMYADGTADAVEFLAKQIRAGADRKVYNMIDVLKMGGI
jgi:4-hydroxy-tetrahydrodipicolinate reductase